VLGQRREMLEPHAATRLDAKDVATQGREIDFTIDEGIHGCHVFSGRAAESHRLLRAGIGPGSA